MSAIFSALWFSTHIFVGIATPKHDAAAAAAAASTTTATTVAGPSLGLFSPDLFILTTYYFEPAISVYGRFTFFVRSAWGEKKRRGKEGGRGRERGNGGTEKEI